MIEIGLGVVAIVAAAWALRERGRAQSVSKVEQASRAELARLRLNSASVEEELRLVARAALEQSDAASAAAQSSLRRAEAELAAARKNAAATEAAHERTRTQVTALRRTLADTEQERDHLTAALDEARKAEVGFARAERARAAAEANLAVAEAAKERAEQARQATDLERATLLGRLDELERDRARLAREARTGGRTLFARPGESNLRVEELSQQLDQTRAERDELASRVTSLHAEVQRVATAQTTRLLLAVPEAPTDAALFAPQRRAATEAALRDTYIATQSSGAVLMDELGLAWGRVGNPLVVERLAASAVLLALASAAVPAALGRPAQIVSEMYGVYGRHLAWLPGADRWLALMSSREVPALALRLATLRLVGPELAPPVEMDAASSAGTPDRRLSAWAARRGAEAVAVAGIGDPIGTDSRFAAACAVLNTTVLALYRRARRDGFTAGFTVQWRASDDATLTATPLEDGATIAWARFAAPPAQRVLDDLCATVRWAEPANVTRLAS